MPWSLEGWMGVVSQSVSHLYDTKVDGFLSFSLLTVNPFSSICILIF